MTQILLIFGSSASGLGALGVNGSAFVIQLITFILAYIVLRKYAFKPILKVLAERRDKIEQGVKLGETMLKKEQDLEKQVSQSLHQARLSADQMISEAQSSAQSIIKEAEIAASVRADLLINEAKGRINLEATQMKQKVESEIIDLITKTSETILKHKLDESSDRNLIAESLKDQQRVA